MIGIIIILSGILFGLILVCTICTIIDYCEWKYDRIDECCPKISFKTFKTMYEINPSAFQKYESCVKYNGDYVEFISYRDMKKYQRYSRIENKNNKKEKSDKATIQMLESFQKDIDNYRKKNESEIKQYSDAIIKQVKESTEKYEKLKSEPDDDHMIGSTYILRKIGTNDMITKTVYFSSVEDEQKWIEKWKDELKVTCTKSGNRTQGW